MVLAMLWAQKIIYGKKTFAQVPKLLKDDVREILIDVARKGEAVLADPSPWVLVTKTSENGTTVAVRAWGKPEDWGRVYYYLLEEGKKALDAAGIAIPHSQMDVHIVTPT